MATSLLHLQLKQWATALSAVSQRPCWIGLSLCFFGASATIIWKRWLLFPRKTSSSLPGPPMKPVVGNLFDFDKSQPWIAFTEWKQQYGDVFALRVLGKDVVVLGSLKTMGDLLESRSVNFLHRPTFTVAGELMDLNKSLPFMPYGTEWRACRKLAHRSLSPSATSKYHRLQEDVISLFAKDLLDTPERFYEHARLSSGRIILTITYGISVRTADSEFISHAEETMKIIMKSSVPGAHWCDLLPAMKYLPSWVPFQRYATKGKELIAKLVSAPFEKVKMDMASGMARPSLTQELLSGEPSKSFSRPQYEDRVKWTTGTMYGAGSETTFSAFVTLMMAMAMHPEVQKKAQQEIDSIIGSDALPTVADREKLPYVNAVIKETMRRWPIAPLSIARSASKEEIYNGCLIPEGSIIIPNLWAVALEPHGIYPPEQFIPERFMDISQNVPDPGIYAFGLGKRSCPGKYLAENSIFIFIVTVMASFNLSLPDPSHIPQFTGDLARYPKPFKCNIEARSEGKRILVRNRASQSEA